LQCRKCEGLLRAAALRSLAKALNETRLTDPLVSRSVRRSVARDNTVRPSPRGDGMATPLPRRAAAAVLLALITFTGCTDARSDTTPTTTPAPTTSEPSSPTPDPAAAAKAEVLAAYRNFWAASTEARAHPNRRHPDLAKYAIDKALAAEQATIVLYRQQGIVERGKPILTPLVDRVDLNQDPATAQVNDCVDVSNVQAVYRSTGKSALAPSKSFRHVSTATATLFFGHWVIREITTDRNSTC
jgi:hypothetical protein